MSTLASHLSTAQQRSDAEVVFRGEHAVGIAQLLTIGTVNSNPHTEPPTCHTDGISAPEDPIHLTFPKRVRSVEMTRRLPCVPIEQSTGQAACNVPHCNGHFISADGMLVPPPTAFRLVGDNQSVDKLGRIVADEVGLTASNLQQVPMGTFYKSALMGMKGAHARPVLSKPAMSGMRAVANVHSDSDPLIVRIPASFAIHVMVRRKDDSMSQLRNGDKVLVVRYPSIGRFNTMWRIVELHNDPTVSLHREVIMHMQGDVDGDALSVIVPPCDHCADTCLDVCYPSWPSEDFAGITGPTAPIINASNLRDLLIGTNRSSETVDRAINLGALSQHAINAEIKLKRMGAPVEMHSGPIGSADRAIAAEGRRCLCDLYLQQASQSRTHASSERLGYALSPLRLMRDGEIRWHNHRIGELRGQDQLCEGGVGRRVALQISQPMRQSFLSANKLRLKGQTVGSILCRICGCAPLAGKQSHAGVALPITRGTASIILPSSVAKIDARLYDIKTIDHVMDLLADKCSDDNDNALIGMLSDANLYYSDPKPGQPIIFCQGDNDRPLDIELVDRISSVAIVALVNEAPRCPLATLMMIAIGSGQDVDMGDMACLEVALLASLVCCPILPANAGYYTRGVLNRATLRGPSSAVSDSASVDKMGSTRDDPSDDVGARVIGVFDQV